MKRRKVFFSTLLTVVMLFASCFTSAAAESTVVVAPENVLNVQVVDKDGNPVNEITMTLKDKNTNDVMATWTSGLESVTEQNDSGISWLGFGKYFNVPQSKFEQSVLPSHKLVALRKEFGSGYQPIDDGLTFAEGQNIELTLYSVDESIPSDMTVPAGKFIMVVDADLASRECTRYIRLSGSNGFLKEYSLDTSEKITYDLEPGSYSVMYGMESLGASSASKDIVVSDQPTDYILKKFNIADIISGYNVATGNFTSNTGKEYSLLKDSDNRVASLFFHSGSVVTAAIPDDEGYVEVYVEKETREYAISDELRYEESDSSGSSRGSDSVDLNYDNEAFDNVQTINFVAIAYPEEGTTLAYVPAGDYIVELSNVPETYKASAQEVTVKQTTDVQTLEIVLEDADQHTHTADKSKLLNDENTHWYQCTGCDVRLEEKNHTPGPEATEDDPQTCTVCGYEIAPKKEHVHALTAEYKNNKDNHWNECTTCGANENVEPHTPGPEATEEAPQTCTVCGYEIAPKKEHVHAFGEEYSKDADKHWKVCASCRKMSEEASHTFGWVIDKEATESVAGSKHEECSICAYKKAAVEIPATGENKPQPTPDDDDDEDTQEPAPAQEPAQSVNEQAAPKTGDNTPHILYIALFVMGAAVLVAERIITKYKKR